jgi:hypothetical protein
MTAVGQTCRLQIEQGSLHTASQGAHAKCPHCIYVCGESSCFSGMHVDPQTLHSRTLQYDAQHGVVCLFERTATQAVAALYHFSTHLQHRQGQLYMVRLCVHAGSNPPSLQYTSRYRFQRSGYNMGFPSCIDLIAAHVLTILNEDSLNVGQTSRGWALQGAPG